jgi:hypothetical protein
VPVVIPGAGKRKRGGTVGEWVMDVEEAPMTLEEARAIAREPVYEGEEDLSESESEIEDGEVEEEEDGDGDERDE